MTAAGLLHTAVVAAAAAAAAAQRKKEKAAAAAPQRKKEKAAASALAELRSLVAKDPHLTADYSQTLFRIYSEKFANNSPLSPAEAAAVVSGLRLR